MTRNQRKWHVIFWIALAVLLPIGIISARLVTPKPAFHETLQPAPMAQLPDIVKKVEGNSHDIYLRRAGDSSLQLEWINKKVLTVPSAVIYKTKKGSRDLKDAELVGRIEGLGTYRFALNPGTVEQLILYDFIHGEIIETINF